MEKPPVQIEQNENADIAKESFRDQFAHPEKIPFGEASFDAWDIHPIGEEKEVPVLFVCGWGKTPRTYEDGIYEYVKAGRRVLAFSSPAEEAESDNVRTDAYPAAQVHHANAILTLIAAKDLSKVDVIAHSEGCINAAIAAEVAPDLFRHFVLVAPPDLTEKESRLDIIMQASRNDRGLRKGLDVMGTKNAAGLLTEEEKEQYAKEAERYVRSKEDASSWLRERGYIKGLWESTNSVVTSHILRDLKAAGGHGISIVSGVDDEMVSMKKLQTQDASDLGIDGFYSVRGGHSNIYRQPEQFAYLAAHALGALEEKYAKIPPLPPS